MSEEPRYSGKEECACCRKQTRKSDQVLFHIAKHDGHERPDIILCDSCAEMYRTDLCGECADADRERTALDLAEYEELQGWITENSDPRLAGAPVDPLGHYEKLTKWVCPCGNDHFNTHGFALSDDHIEVLFQLTCDKCGKGLDVVYRVDRLEREDKQG